MFAENQKVLIPSNVVLDKLATLTYETVDLPSPKKVNGIVKKLKLEPPEKHLRYAGHSLEHNARLQKAAAAAHELIPKFSEGWKKRFGKPFNLIETFMLEDADVAFVLIGSISANAKLAIEKLRESGLKIGLVRLRAVTPWPEADLQEALANVQRIAVIDNLISVGGWSKLYEGISTFYKGLALNFIYAYHISIQEFMEIAEKLAQSEKPERIWLV